MLLTILGAVDFGLNAQEAVDAPRFHHQWLPDQIYHESGALSAETVRESVPPARSRELREAVAATIDFNVIPGGTLMGFASWSIDCGVELPPEAALRAAQLANRLYDHAGALRFVRSVPDHRKRPEMVLQEANALRSLGELNAAAEALESVLEAARGNLRLWTLLCVERHRVLRRLPGRAAEAHAAVENGAVGKVLIDVCP